MNQIQFFKNDEFGAIRTMSNEQGEVMFCGHDVALALGYTKPRNAIAHHVDEGDKTTALIQGSGSNYKTWATFINESGLYALIFSSQLESAKRFKHWITGEVLPAIRKQGGYIHARPDETDEEVLARGILVMQATLQRRAEEIARLKPKADYVDHVLDSVSCFTTTQIAKEMGMTGCELNFLLRTLGIQYRQSGQYMLYADYARLGLAKSRTHKHVLKHGMVMTEMYLVWTERGREFIHRLLNPKYLN